MGVNTTLVWMKFFGIHHRPFSFSVSCSIDSVSCGRVVVRYTIVSQTATHKSHEVPQLLQYCCDNNSEYKIGTGCRCGCTFPSVIRRVPHKIILVYLILCFFLHHLPSLFGPTRVGVINCQCGKNGNQSEGKRL